MDKSEKLKEEPMEGIKMKKTERKSRREIANNFYVPPPARKLEDNESKSTPQCRKLEGSDSSNATELSKTKDRSQETKPKKVAEETKICNNSSLLFKCENESIQPAQNNTDSCGKKKRRKKKKKKLSTIEQKIESEMSNLAGDSFLKTEVNQISLSNESEEEVGEGFWEIGPSIKAQMQQPIINDLPITYPSYSQTLGSSNTYDCLMKKESHAYMNQGKELLHDLDKLTLRDTFEDKSNGLYHSDLNKHKISKDQEQNIGHSPNGAISKVCQKKLKKKKSHSSSSTETDVSLNLNNSKSNDISVNVEDEYEWEKLIDDGFPEFDLNKSGNTGIENAKATKSYSFNHEKDSSDSSIIEIYGFPEEFKTQDLLAAFSSFVNRGLKLKWVDNTHALGIFPTPLLADEALNSPLPFVRTRPLSQASPASKEKAQHVILPAALRPKTCTALARRLVSGALGVRAVFTKEEREAEREMLKEAREQKRMAAKQRDAAWEGKF